MSYARVRCVGLVGVTGHVVQVEADLAPGLPTVAITGLPDTALHEARDRVRAAVVNSGRVWPNRRITINLLPATLPKQGSGFDLSIVKLCHTSMMTRAAIYCRISRDREGAGLGVERQYQDCIALVESRSWTIAETYTDNDLSAYRGKPRPGYRKLLNDITTGLIDTVVAWHTDRLHRSPVELEEYIAACDQHGVPTHTVKAGPLDLATPSGRLVARQLGAVARYEVEHSIERQQRAKLQAATDGRWKGGRRPFGYEADGVTVRPTEAQVVQDATTTILAGGSLRGIATNLNLHGVVTSTGRAWSPTELRKMLLRPRNAGLMEHRGEVVGYATWPPLVDEDRWRAAASVLTDPARRTQTSGARRWLLSGIAWCGVCGAPLRCTLQNSNRAGVPSYTCKASKHVARNAVELEAYVYAVVVERLSRPDAIDLLSAPDRATTSALHTDAAALRERLNELATAYAEGAIDAQQLRQGSERLRSRLAELNVQRATWPGDQY
ncbi:recombinase family protein [Salinispora arenicola]|nr:recombinase family protein [Salinispora arenicola]NIL62154.1 recombinase family protein [Salinispora arenicola]